MPMGLTPLLKKGAVRLLLFVERWRERINYWKIQSNANIKIARTTRILPTAVVNTYLGGEISIGKNTEVLEGVVISTYGGRIHIGDQCSINPYTIVYGHGNTTIGNNVLIAAGCMIIPSNHNFTDASTPINSQGATSLGIVIEDDVWIGHGCSILDGVTIGKGTIVAAGSVVNKSIKPMSIIAGVPAKLIGHR